MGEESKAAGMAKALRSCATSEDFDLKGYGHDQAHELEFPLQTHLKGAENSEVKVGSSKTASRPASCSMDGF